MPGKFNNNEVMIAEYYDDMQNLKLFIRFFHFFIILIKRA